MSSSVLLSPKTVVGRGPSSILIEPRANAVRIKPRGAPEMWIPYDVLAEFSRVLGALSGNVGRARP